MTTPDRYALYKNGALIKAFPTWLQCETEALERGWCTEGSGDYIVGYHGRHTVWLWPGVEIRPIPEAT